MHSLTAPAEATMMTRRCFDMCIVVLVYKHLCLWHTCGCMAVNQQSKCSGNKEIALMNKRHCPSMSGIALE